MRKYDNYKDVSWYEYTKEIPKNWEILPNIAIFDERRVKNTENEENLSVSKYKGIVKSSTQEAVKDRASENKSEYLLVKEGDIAYNTMLMWSGAVGSSLYRGIVSPAYTVLKPKKNINSRYFHYQFRNEFYCDYSRRFSYGINDARLRLYYVYFKRMYSIVPPLETQNKIAEYLDKKQEQTEQFIAKQEKIIELMKEQKKAIINQAVTKGINPDVKMKDSGVEWLGEIPEHWELLKIKYVANLRSGETITSEKIFANGEYQVFGGNGLRGYTNKYTHEGHFVLIGRQGALCGNVNYAKGKFYASEHAVVCKLKKVYEVIWFGEVIREMNLNQYSQSAAQPGLAVENITKLYMPVPNLQEQKEIVAYIEEKTAKIDTAISRAEQEIKLTKEYMESLIYNAVTGQIRVE
jgi:type I restriction enzyme, S subunit